MSNIETFIGSLVIVFIIYWFTEKLVQVKEKLEEIAEILKVINRNIEDRNIRKK